MNAKAQELGRRMRGMDDTLILMTLAREQTGLADVQLEVVRSGEKLTVRVKSGPKEWALQNGGPIVDEAATARMIKHCMIRQAVHRISGCECGGKLCPAFQVFAAEAGL